MLAAYPGEFRNSAGFGRNRLEVDTRPLVPVRDGYVIPGGGVYFGRRSYRARAVFDRGLK